MQKRFAPSRLVVPALFVLFSAYCLLPAAYCVLRSDDKRLLETGGAAKAAARAATDELKVVSYNMRYRAGEDLKAVVELLRRDPEIGGAAVIGLQEVDRNKKRTGHTNTAREMAAALGMNYVWAAPPNPRPKDGEKRRGAEGEEEEETGVAILSAYPLADVERIVLAHEGPNRRRRAAIGATVRVGEATVRVYSVHAETRMPVEKKVEHWGAVLEDLARHPHVRHVVVLGDFNTIKGKDVRAARRLFTGAGFHTPFADGDATFRVVFFDFKLDWIWLRGLTAAGHGIDREVGLSDHWPLWAKVRLDKMSAPPPTTTAPPVSVK